MLTIEGLNTHYGASHVLQGIDLTVREGRICSVLGRNGVGKTTTLRTVMGLVPPSGGRVRLDGTDITGWSPHRVARAGRAGRAAHLSRPDGGGEHPRRGTPAVEELAASAADGAVPTVA